MKGKNIILIGAPGCGKGTLAKMLAEHYGFIIISMGDLLRTESTRDTSLGQLLKPLLGTGGLVPDEMVTTALRNELSRIPFDKDVLFDGYPRSIPQVMSLDGIMDSLDTDVTVVLHLEVSNAVVMERIKKRALIEGRKDDQEESTVLRRLEAFRKTTEPVIAHYKMIGKLININGEETPDQVFFSAVKSIQPKAPPVNLNDRIVHTG